MSVATVTPQHGGEEPEQVLSAVDIGGEAGAALAVDPQASGELAARPRLCPPHHWLIAAQPGTIQVQIWTCCRCATRQEVASTPVTRWRGATRVREPAAAAAEGAAPAATEQG